MGRAGRFSLCVHTETPPYKYVSVVGAILAVEASNLDRDLRPLAHRYLGAERGEEYITATQEEHSDNVLIRMRPERWLTADFGKTNESS